MGNLLQVMVVNMVNKTATKIVGVHLKLEKCVEFHCDSNFNCHMVLQHLFVAIGMLLWKNK